MMCLKLQSEIKFDRQFQQQNAGFCWMPFWHIDIALFFHPESGATVRYDAVDVVGRPQWFSTVDGWKPWNPGNGCMYGMFSYI